MLPVYILITICAGMTSALQSGTNQMLQKSLATPIWAVAIVASVTALAAVAIAMVSGQKLPEGAAVAGAPWWAWIGGLLGIGFVLGTVFATPKLGAGLFIALLVTAELLTALLLDHFGLLGIQVHRAGIMRIVGGTLMIGGVILIGLF